MRNHLILLLLCLLFFTGAYAQDREIKWLTGVTVGTSLNSTYYNDNYSFGLNAAGEVSHRLGNRFWITSGAGISWMKYDFEGVGMSHEEVMNSRRCPVACFNTYGYDFVSNEILSLVLPLNLQLNVISRERFWGGLKAGGKYYLNLAGRINEYRTYSDKEGNYSWSYHERDGLAGELLLNGNWSVKPNLIFSMDMGLAAFYAPIHLKNWGSYEEEMNLSPLINFKLLLPGR
ncbi:MAG: hypothetical protein WD077_13430 [Bacteroidia bacterium]